MAGESAKIRSRPWKFKPQDHAALIDSLRQQTHLSPLTLQVCVSRGLTDTSQIERFLNPKLENIQNPFSIQDMEKAVVRLAQARESADSVLIYGDYDVDGTTGAALLSWVFREMGFRAEATQPDRFKDGYGLNPGAVRQAHERGFKVLVTVDCGITSFEAARLAQELGIDLIIVDHHQIDAVQGLPIAHAILDPQRADCPSGLKQLCGCGLAFYLSMALRSRGRERGWFESGQEPNLKRHLDLVVMATSADMVPLTGDNHILVRQGLQVLKASQKPGVRALLQAAGVGQGELSPGHLGFVIGPRINASGRLSSASLALELLSTTDEERAAELAGQLEALNQERMEIQNRIWDEVKQRVETALAQGRFKNGIVVADAGWHEGVVGIVASRVTETFQRPAAVIALREDFGKGSVRSYAGKDVLQALREASGTLLGFGGHRHAAGLSLDPGNLEAFSQAFDEALGKSETQENPLWIEAECRIEDLDFKTLQELECLGPFGPGNPEPVFSLQAGLHAPRVLKGRHLKFSLLSASQSSLDAIWFHAASELDQIQGNSEWAGVPELNRFRGKVTPTFRVRDRKPSAARPEERTL